MDYFIKIMRDVLNAIYKFTFASLLFAVVFMFAYLIIRKSGIRKALRTWIGCFKRSSEFRRVFVLTFYIMMVLFRTVLCREVGRYPVLSNVVGIWGMHYPGGKVYTDNIENLMLFIPMTMLLMWALSPRIFRNREIRFGSVLWESFKISFVISAGIEVLQLFFKLGTIQLSDLCYNVLGGTLGGVLYYLIHRLRCRRQGSEKKEKNNGV